MFTQIPMDSYLISIYLSVLVLSPYTMLPTLSVNKSVDRPGYYLYLLERFIGENEFIQILCVKGKFFRYGDSVEGQLAAKGGGSIPICEPFNRVHFVMVKAL